MKMAIRIKNLTKSYDSLIALDNFNKTFTSNINGIIGPNGAGKSTLFKCIVGLIRPTKGSIRISNKTIDDNWVLLNTGYLDENPTNFFTDLTCVEFLHYSLGHYRKISSFNRFQKEIMDNNLIKRFQFSPYLYRSLASLSKGLKRRLDIIRCFLHNPLICILDEPLSGLDPKSAIIFEDYLTTELKDRIIILSSHDLRLVETICEDITLIDKGKCKMTGKASSIIHKPSVVTLDYYISNIDNQVLLIKEEIKDIRSIIIRDEKITIQVSNIDHIETRILQWFLSKNYNIRTRQFFLSDYYKQDVSEIGS